MSTHVPMQQLHAGQPCANRLMSSRLFYWCDMQPGQLAVAAYGTPQQTAVQRAAHEMSYEEVLPSRI